MHWTQAYDPFGHWWLSTLVAGLPIIVLFSLLAGFKVKPHWCAIAGALTAMSVAILFFKMQLILAVTSFGYGVAFGMLKIAWIVLAAVYLYDISVETGQFEIMKESIAGITPARRLQVLFWRLHRWGGGFRRACGHCRRFHDRARIQALSRGCAESNCEHRARGLGRDWHSGSHPCRSHRAP